jgi:uncharacterized protein YjiK
MTFESLQGLTYCSKTNRLYAAAFNENAIYEIQTELKGAKLTATRSVIAQIPQPIGIAADGQGKLYVASGEQAVYVLSSGSN